MFIVTATNPTTRLRRGECVPARSKSSNDISLLTELAEISQTSLFYKRSAPNGTVAGSCKAETGLIDG
jgi:hypothetical protein